VTNWILTLTRNNLQLTRKAVETFLAQDIGNIKVLLIDDNSTDGTLHWAWSCPQVVALPRTQQSGVAAMWNTGLGFILGEDDYAQGETDYALVANNDVELRPDTYRWLLEDGGGFVTAVGSQDREKIKPMTEDQLRAYRLGKYPLLNTPYRVPDSNATRPHPDFSCYLIRKEVYTSVGPFDENFKVAFCEDWDYHCRLHQAGVQAHCIDLPFLHLSSQTVQNSTPEERDLIYKQAAANREHFKAKWGMEGGSQEYYDFFKQSLDLKQSLEPDSVLTDPDRDDAL